MYKIPPLGLLLVNIISISKVKVNSCCGLVDKMQQPKQLHVKRCEIREK